MRLGCNSEYRRCLREGLASSATQTRVYCTLTRPERFSLTSGLSHPFRPPAAPRTAAERHAGHQGLETRHPVPEGFHRSCCLDGSLANAWRYGHTKHGPAQLRLAIHLFVAEQHGQTRELHLYQSACLLLNCQDRDHGSCLCKQLQASDTWVGGTRDGWAASTVRVRTRLAGVLTRIKLDPGLRGTSEGWPNTKVRAACLTGCPAGSSVSSKSCRCRRSRSASISRTQPSSVTSARRSKAAPSEAGAGCGRRMAAPGLP